MVCSCEAAEEDAASRALVPPAPADFAPTGPYFLPFKLRVRGEKSGGTSEPLEPAHRFCKAAGEDAASWSLVLPASVAPAPTSFYLPILQAPRPRSAVGGGFSEPESVGCRRLPSPQVAPGARGGGPERGEQADSVEPTGQRGSILEGPRGLFSFQDTSPLGPFSHSTFQRPPTLFDPDLGWW